MELIYSKVSEGLLLHAVNRLESIDKPRKDLVSDDQFIQCSALNLPKNTTFKPHQHVWKDGPSKCIAQESWVVIKGLVECKFYDLDGTHLANILLRPGDASFTFQGGHNYVSLQDNTIVYEYKTGPYLGQLLDKKFI